MYIISKEFHFSASHILYGLPKDHPCGRLHGHNYVVIIYLKSKTLDDKGFVKDYGELKPIKDFIDDKFDHRHLNEVMKTNPTAENLAKFIYDVVKEKFSAKIVHGVMVKETPKTEATYYGN